MKHDFATSRECYDKTIIFSLSFSQMPGRVTPLAKPPPITRIKCGGLRAALSSTVTAVVNNTFQETKETITDAKWHIQWSYAFHLLFTPRDHQDNIYQNLYSLLNFFYNGDENHYAIINISDELLSSFPGYNSSKLSVTCSTYTFMSQISFFKQFLWVKRFK